MNHLTNLRIAWLFPSLGRGPTGYPWHPIFKAFAALFPNTTVFTGGWPGFAPGFEGTFTVKVVGKTFKVGSDPMKYKRGLMYLSPGIVGFLLQFKPDVIFANAFSAWTVLATMLKSLMGWRIVILYEGSSPTADSRDSKVRSFFRRNMAQAADAFVTNSQGGKQYLTDVLGADASRVFAFPYEVPTQDLLLRYPKTIEPENQPFKRPVFLYVGQVIQRKGIHFLLEACEQLKQRGYSHFTLLVGGDGPHRAELEAQCRDRQLEDCVQWAGWVDYESLGSYFQIADAFVFPTLEDTWGMVVLEAMTFGKPVLSSKFAGASELVTHHENGYLFNPNHPEEIANLMQQLIDNPNLIREMGEKSQQIIAAHTAEAVSHSLAAVVDFVNPKALQN